MIKNIDSFSKIRSPISNTLVVLDIDDTLLSFQHFGKQWWDDTYRKLLPIYKENTYLQAELLWTKQISKIKPYPLDKYNLKNFLNGLKYNCEIILLTARDKSISKLTIKQLNECELYIDPSRIFYSRNKGKELENIVINIFPNT